MIANIDKLFRRMGRTGKRKRRTERAPKEARGGGIYRAVFVFRFPVDFS